jgi:aminobenzoyl-glutamate utilization protein B
MTFPRSFALSFPSLVALLCTVSLRAGTDKAEVWSWMDRTKAPYEALAMELWELAEVGFKETESSRRLQDRLTAEGFRVESGVAGMPTAFVASYGEGSPVIAILGEFDALPGLAQEAVPERKERPGQIAGHACGHHLFGPGSAHAAVAVKEWLRSTGRSGTVRYFGTPAEEGGSGKAYMVRAGLFDDVDATLHWHPADRNFVRMSPTLAKVSAKFRFRGMAAHASGAPERGRSALDGVEAMNHMANLMREHVPDSTRIHYVITKGGEAPNVVPAFAEVYYYARSPQRDLLVDIWARLEDAARGAALGTGTMVEWEIVGGDYELLYNETLGRAMHANLSAVGGVIYEAGEQAFAEAIGRTLFGSPMAPETAALILPFDPKPGRGIPVSTDVGDVSWVTPTMGVHVATWAPGTPAHSWQAVACGGTTMALKGMAVGAKTVAATAIDLFADPAFLADVRAEFLRVRGDGFTYKPLIGDRAPPLDYRE